MSHQRLVQPDVSTSSHAPARVLSRQSDSFGSGRTWRPVVIGSHDDPLEQKAARASRNWASGPAGVVPAVQTGKQTRRSSDMAPASVNKVLDKSGVPLDSKARHDMEHRFGHDFSQVRVHADTEAAQSAKDVRARAYTVGNKVVFNASQYAPDSKSGRSLIAHELTHVMQQARLDASYGTPGGQPHAVAEGESKQLSVPGGGAAQLLQREPEAGTPPVDTSPEPIAPAEGGETVPADAGRQPAAGTPPTLAAPTLTLGPAAALTRGDTLTATLAFAPTSGETMNVSAWRYVTANHGDVDRPTTDTGFQTSWSGTMAMSGTLAVDYAITPSGGTASATQTLRQAVTVNDRIGTSWASSPTLQNEVAYSGRPSPPSVFSDLGLHHVSITNPAATSSSITAGPNTGFSYVGSLTAGTYTSQPKIHPDLTNATSTFKTFHNDPSRLYLLIGTARTLVPQTEYSNLSTAGGTLTFTVPDWEVFYKAKHFYRVTATGTSGAGPVTLQDAWWGLASNSESASLVVRDDAAIRTALSIPGTEGYSLSATSLGSWDGYQLMQSAAILTGTRSHEYVHARHSHRANFTAMLRAVDPQRKSEQQVSSPSNTVDFTAKIAEWVAEILKPNHELVDEAASRTAEAFVVVPGQEMAAVNTDPSNGASLGSVWNITGDQQMGN